MKRISMMAIVVLLFAGTAWGTVTQPESVSVAGSTAALVYQTSAGAVSRIELLFNSTIKDYGSASTIGSIAWAIGQLSYGGKLHLGNGTYPVATPITVNQSILMEGDSQATTIVQATDGISPNNVINISVPNVSLEHMTVNVNGQGGCAVLVNSGLSGFTLDHVTVENAYAYGLFMISDSNVSITNSTFIGNAQGNGANVNSQLYMKTISSSPNVNGVRICNCIFDDTGGGASRIVDLYIVNNTSGVTMQNIVITGNVVRYTGLGSAETDGIVISTGGTSGAVIESVTVSNNVITETGASTNGQGIEMWDTLNSTMSNNTINGAYDAIGTVGFTGTITGNTVSSTMYGITMASSSSVIFGNFIQVSGIGGAGYGILIGNAGSADVNASSNEVVLGSNALAGIYVENGASNLLMNDNYIVGSGSDGGNYAVLVQYGTVAFTAQDNHFSGLGCGWVFGGSTTITGSLLSGNTYNSIGSCGVYTSVPPGITIKDSISETYATLPSVPSAGSSIYCSDCAATTPASPTCAAGGGEGRIVRSNGTNWLCD